MTYIVLTIFFFWHRDWLLGIFLLATGMFIGGVGQRLPHRREQGLRELAQDLRAEESRGLWRVRELPPEESYALASAIFRTCLILAVTGAVLIFRLDFRWYIAIGVACAASFVFFLLSVVVVFSPALWALRRSKRASRQGP